MTAGDYHKLVQDKLAAFGREFKDLNIFLFPEILERIAAMERVLTRPGGSLLLLGRSGVGRRSCTRLVSRPTESTFERCDRKNGVHLGRSGVDLSKLVISYLQDEEIKYNILSSFIEINRQIAKGDCQNLDIDASTYSCEGLRPIGAIPARRSGRRSGGGFRDPSRLRTRPLCATLSFGRESSVSLHQLS